MTYRKRKGNVLYVLALVLAFVLAGISAGIIHLKSLPSINQLEQYEPTLTSQITSNDNRIIKTFGAYNYKKVTVSQMPDYLKQAIVAIEDKNFHSHHGFDVKALIRSSLKNIKAGKIVQGASTITQQLARVLFLSQERTFTRKFKELIIAHRLEKTISKDKILEMYLNNIYLGEGAYGVAAAADIYFDKKIEDLNLRECALIAGLPQAPSVYSPYRNKKLALQRRSQVLRRMFEDGFITKEQLEITDTQEVELNSKPKKITFTKAPYFVDFVMKELRDRVGLSEQEVVQGGYKIYTTLNYEYQKAAEKSVVNNLKGWGLTKPEEQAALISYDVVSGQIMAYIGGKDYAESQFDRVSQAIRPPGSSFKIFVYTTAMEQGLTPFTMYPDLPLVIGDWRPQNYGRKYRTKLPLYKALALSSNVVAAQLIMDVGVSNVIKTARKMGITTPLERDPTIALGSSGVKPIELASAYGILANGGIKVDPYGIERIETSNGKVIYVASNSYKRILDIKTVAYMVEMFKQVVKHGTGRASNIGRPSAGKTGTTDGYRDAWFAGFTPDIVTTVWVGNDNNTPTNRLTGGSIPAVIWRDYMKMITSNKPVMDFMYPEIIVNTTYEKGIHQNELEEMLGFEITDFKEEERKKKEKSEIDDAEIQEPEEVILEGEEDKFKEERDAILEKYRKKYKKINNNKEIKEGEVQEEFNPIPVPAKQIKVKTKYYVPPAPRKEPSIRTSGF